MTALVGYLDQVTIKDAIAHAKGFAKRRFEAADASWYAVMPFDDGFLYEVHEGGAGHGYLAGVAAALSPDDVPTVWIPRVRKSVVWGRSVAVSVDLGGRGI